MLDFHQVTWDSVLADDCRQIVRLAVREDLDRHHDWTTLALVDPESNGGASMVARESGILAGLPALRIVVSEMNLAIELEELVEDGQSIEAGTRICRLAGPSGELLTAERTLLNLVGRLSGIASLTARFVQAVEGCTARIYDTRKTTPGWRRLEKYAVRCGGGSNHRSGLYDALLIKDNHLAVGNWSPGKAVNRCREFLTSQSITGPDQEIIVEVEVDTLPQLQEALKTTPDIVLLDNMSIAELLEAVQLRDSTAPQVQLEASGSIQLANVREVAETGVNRISIGALTHAAQSLDIGLDWDERAE